MKKRILLAEDDQAYADSLNLKLTNEGYEVVPVRDGEAAMIELKTGAFDLLILDLLMPIMGGIQVLERLKQASISIATIVLTQVETRAETQRVTTLGASEILLKSEISLADLVARVRARLGESATTPAAGA